MPRRRYSVVLRNHQGSVLGSSGALPRMRSAIARAHREARERRLSAEVWAAWECYVGRVATGTAHELLYCALPGGVRS